MMNKKNILLILSLMLSLGIHAQFQQGKGYLGASLTGLDLHYNAQNKFNIGLEAKAGYLAWDNIMLLADVSFEHNGSEAVADHISLGACLLYTSPSPRDSANYLVCRLLLEKKK